MATAAPPAAPAQPVNNQAHLYRLLNLTVDEGTSIVRQIFDEKRLSYKPGLDLNAFLTQERSTIQNNKQIQSYLKDKLFPKSGTPTHSLEDFDLTLLVSLLRNLSSLGLQGPWKNEPKPGEEKPEDDLRRLQIMRNGLAHIKSTTGISEQEFESKWSDTENVLLRLNNSLNNPDLDLQQRIEECKTKPLDSEGLEQRVERLQKSITDDLKGIKTDIGNLTSKTEGWFQKLDKKIEKIGTNQEQQTSLEVLKEDLEAFYIDKHSTIPLSPLLEEQDTPLFDFYHMPGMNDVKLVDKKEVKTEINLSQVYKSGSDYSREIYISADAGYGKTAFSKYMTVLWCQAHFPDVKYTEHLKEKDVNAMREFKLIFLVLLRESSDCCSIDDLIYNQIVRNLSHSGLYSKLFLQDILHRERCLVVLDGLDEWINPDIKSGNQDKSIPYRKPRKNCTILTTTRPWKLSTLKLGINQMDKKIELSNLDRNSASELAARALTKIRGKTNQVEMKSEAIELVNIYKDFEQLYVPLLLMYIICLWCESKQVVKTKCELYIRIIELLLSRTIEKYEGHPETERFQCISDIQQYFGAIPQCFKGQDKCHTYFTFLTSLGKLAFEKLFSKTRETRLVFEVKKECLKEEFLKLGLLTGIMTQDNQSTLLSKIRITSFSHKTVQEFFAALYISTCPDQERVVTEVRLFCNSIQDILELSKVFIFISGINAELFSSFSHKLMKTINNDEITRRYRSRFCDDIHVQPLKEIQNMFVSCIRESPDKEDVSFCLQDFLFDKFTEESYYRSLQRLALQNKTNITSIHMKEGVDNVSKIIDDCKFSDPAIHCEVIKFSCRCEEEDLFCLLSTSVKSLFISYDKQRDDESKHGCSSLTDWRSHLTGEQCKTFHNASSLETIHIKKVMSHDFVNYIINVKSIKEISLFRVSCSDHAESCPGFNFDLSQHSELRKLELDYINFTLFDMNLDERKDGRSCLIDEQSKTFHNSRQLETISINYSTLGHEILCHILNIKSLKKIELSGRPGPCSDHGDSCPLFSFDLSKYPELRELELRVDSTFLDMNEDGIVLRNIEEVMLMCGVKLSCSCLRRLVEIIEKLEHSVEVYLWDCTITPEEEFDRFKDYICSRSESFVVTQDDMYMSSCEIDQNFFEFVTKK